MYSDLVQNCLKSRSKQQKDLNKNLTMNQRKFWAEDYNSQIKMMFDDEPEVFGHDKKVPSIFTINGLNLTTQEIHVENCGCDERESYFRKGIQIQFFGLNTDKSILKSITEAISKQMSSNWNLFLIKQNTHQ